MSSFKNTIFYTLLYLLPKNMASCLMGKLVSLALPTKFAVRVSKAFAQIFKIDLSEAEKNLDQYACLQDFFVRKLKAGIRPIATEPRALISPCDGMLSVADKIVAGQLIQAKGKNYPLADFLGDGELAKKFMNGHYATLYLSPKDYHRFHAPIDGTIKQTLYMPGSLWPVNNWAVKNVQNLFCQNERVITVMQERTTGLWLAYVAVGATMVGRIQLSYAPFTNKTHKEQKGVIEHPNITIEKGQELGQFMFGSTIIMVFQEGLIESFAQKPPSKVKMGEVLGNLT